MDIILKPKKIVLGFSLAVVFFTLANIGVQYIVVRYPPGTLGWLVFLFHVNADGNLPETYSFFALLFCSALLFVIYSEKIKSGDAFARHWFWLSVIFLFLSVDEAAGLHGVSGRVLRLYVDTSGLVTKFTWLVPYAVFVCVFAAAYIRFLVALPSRSRWWIVTAGVMFVAGAWGGEFMADRLIGSGIKGGLVHLVLFSVEEFLEMAGIVVFIHALMSYMVLEFKEVAIRVASSPARPVLNKRGRRGFKAVP